MTTPTREDLLGYVLGALEAQEHQQVADCLKTQPELQLELRRIKALVAPLEWSQRPPADFPVGLARRTCEIVARESRQPFGPQCAAAPTRLTRRISQPQSAVPRDASSKPRRARESAALVCCAAVLGAALGPLALQFTQALSRAPAADRAFAANRPAAQSSKTAIATRCRDTTGAGDVIVSSPTILALDQQASEMVFVSDSIPLGNCVGRWNDWRPLAGERSAENRGGDDSYSPNRIGQRLFSRSFHNSEFRPGIQLISN